MACGNYSSDIKLFLVLDVVRPLTWFRDVGIWMFEWVTFMPFISLSGFIQNFLFSFPSRTASCVGRMVVITFCEFNFIVTFMFTKCLIVTMFLTIEASLMVWDAYFFVTNWKANFDFARFVLTVYGQYVSVGINCPSFRLLICSTFVTPCDFNSFWMSSSLVFCTRSYTLNNLVFYEEWLSQGCQSLCFWFVKEIFRLYFQNVPEVAYHCSWVLRIYMVPWIALRYAKASILWDTGVWTSSVALLTRSLGHASFAVEGECRGNICCPVMLICWWWRLKVCYEH